MEILINLPVLPVPDWDWAMTSLPLVIGTIALCWIAEGFSKSNRANYIINNR